LDEAKSARNSNVLMEQHYVSALGALDTEINDWQDRWTASNRATQELERKAATLRVLYHAPAKSGVFSPSGVRSRVMSRILDFVNARCSEYSRFLLPSGQHIQISGTAVTKGGELSSKINLKLVGCKRDYQSFSAGEARRVDIILHLALRDLAMASSRFTTNLLVLDEVLDPLDMAGVRGVIRLLETFAGQTSIWVVTQNEVLRGELDSGILVVKSKGVSSIYALRGA
jgi:DNA repair exonuclease SbcCD ATPase subunit